MNPNITARHDNMGNLMVYLAGPGKGNEHIDQHLVDGSDAIVADFGTDELTPENALLVAAELDQPRRMTGETVKGGHVWHMPLSASPEDGTLTDAQWSKISREMLRDLGFIDRPDRPDVPWVAVRHGVSKEGNDHIHLAVSLIRPDGTKADVWQDKTRVQEIARKIEEKHNLVRIADGFGAKGYTAGAVQAAKARGEVEPEDKRLARAVRAFSVNARTEAEFVYHGRSSEVMIKPSTAPDDDKRVIGYQVAFKPAEGQTARWYAGHKLGNDLGLGVLRKSWDSSPALRGEAQTEWLLARFDQPVTPRPELTKGGTEDMKKAAEQIHGWVEKLNSTPYTNHEEFRRAAAFTSGALASWSRATEPVPGRMAALSDEFARAAQMSRKAYQEGPQVDHRVPSYVHAMIGMGAKGNAAKAALLTALFKMSQKVSRWVQERGDKVKAESLRKVAQEHAPKIAARYGLASQTKVGAQMGVNAVEAVQRLARQAVGESHEQAYRPSHSLVPPSVGHRPRL